MAKDSRAVKEYLDYVVEKLKQGKGFSIGALVVQAKEQDIAIIELLLDTQKRLAKEKIDISNAKRFAQRVDDALLSIKDPPIRGFKSYSNYKESLAKNKFVSRFAALLEGRRATKEGRCHGIPVDKKEFFPEEKARCARGRGGCGCKEEETGGAKAVGAW